MESMQSATVRNSPLARREATGVWARAHQRPESSAQRAVRSPVRTGKLTWGRSSRAAPYFS